MPGFAVIVLAAGGSSRLGTQKQLVVYKSETLLRRSARIALESNADQVIVVLGAQMEQLSSELNGFNVTIAINSNWQLGLGSSIRCGMEAVKPGIAAVVLTLCDMPMVTSDLLDDLANSVNDANPPIAAAEYNCHLGVPCAFHVSRFQELSNLSGDKGARDLVRSAKKIARITFEACAIDIDTSEDLKRLEAR